MIAERQRCLVPFCKRTRGVRYEWICGEHWRAVPKETKRAMFSLARSYRRKFGTNHPGIYDPGSPQRLEAVRIERAWREAWQACKASAIEKAMGI